MKYALVAAMPIVAVVIIVAISSMDGRVNGVVDTSTENYTAATVFGPFAATYTVDGHKYVVFFKAAPGSVQGGVAAVHSQACDCLKQK